MTTKSVQKKSTKKVETKKTVEKPVNTEHTNAVLIAEKIKTIMGDDFFTIDQMRKKMTIIDEKNHTQKLSWNVAKGYIASITNYGLVEDLKAVKDTFKIRIDADYRLNYINLQIAYHQAKIKALEQLKLEINPIVKKGLKSK